MDKDKRFVNFLLAAVALLAVNYFIAQRFAPKPAQPPAAAAPADQEAGEQQGGEQKPEGQPAEAPKPGEETPAAPADPNAPAAEQPAAAGDKPAEAATPEAPAEPPQPLKLATIGSLDPADDFRMLVTLTSQGAGVRRVELTDGYFNIEDRSGYLGQLDVTDSGGTGARVVVVGRGTPAAKAGIEPGDVITAVGAEKVTDALGFQRAMARTRPGQKVAVSYDRGGESRRADVVLTRRPMEVLSPVDIAKHAPDFPPVANPPSLVLFLEQLDAEKRDPKAQELAGTELRNANWELVTVEPAHVAFRRTLPAAGIEIIKHYRLQKAGEAQIKPGYHLTLDVELRNTGSEKRTLSYSLDGPNGLPIEGWWYAMKVGKPWAASTSFWDHFSAIGLRDVVVGTQDGQFTKFGMVRNLDIVDGDFKPWLVPPQLVYIGVDAQYFASVLFPLHEQSEKEWIKSSQPVRAGPVPPNPRLKNLTNVSSRVTTQTIALEPGAPAITHHYRLFAGPKTPAIVSAYKLDPLIYYGWYEAVSVVLVKVLHFFHDYMVFNYGLAIILLTVVVRTAMFPLSRKQALNMQKMQELQPEIKRLQEKYKNQPEQFMKAQRELFSKANYNPLSGCLPMLVQIPIFLGLYRALAVDVQLRDAPLISHSIQWASNLAAPDRLYDWSAWMPQIAQDWLGPYFNILPLATIGLFLWQQKMFMPPPADEQQAMQQKIMKYMMVFMGLLFFKVPSGLCIYFIASSTWGILERKFLPKVTPAGGGPAPGGGGGKPGGGNKPVAPVAPAPNGNGRSGGGARPKKSKRS